MRPPVPPIQEQGSDFFNIDGIEIDDTELNIDNTLTDFRGKKSELEAGVKSLREELGVATKEDKISSKEDLDAFIKKSFEALGTVTLAAQELENPNHRKTPEESQKLLENLVRQQNQFFVDMKIAQVHQVGFVINAAETIKDAELKNDLLSIPKHTVALRATLDPLKVMPSLDDFEARSSEIARLVALHPLVASQENVVDGIKSQNATSRVMSAGISQAFRENFQAMSSLAPKEVQPEVAQAAIAEVVSKSPTQNITTSLHNIAQEAAFTNAISEQFQRAFIVDNAIKDGKVKENDNSTDKAVAAIRTFIGVIPIPVAVTAAGIILTAAQTCNDAQKAAKNRNRANFANVETLSLGVTDAVSRKLYNSYSAKTDGQVAPLDNLSEEGQEKFAGVLVEHMMREIGSFKQPSPEEIAALSLNDADFRSNKKGPDEQEGYRDKILRQTGIEVDVKRLGEETYFAEIATQIENKTYVDFLSNRLISQVVHGRDGGMVPKEISEAIGKVRFEENDLANPEKTKVMTFDGLVARVGIVTADGQKLLSDGRKESKGGESKYGFRAATPEEEAMIKSQSSISGYSKYTPDLANFEEKKTDALSVLQQKDFTSHKFKVTDDPQETKQNAVIDLIGRYKAAKIEDPKLKPLTFLKSKESGFETGEKVGITGTRGEARDEFNAIKEPVMAMMVAAEGISMSDLKKLIQPSKDREVSSAEVDNVTKESSLSSMIPTPQNVATKEAPEKAQPKQESSNPAQTIAEIAKAAREQLAKAAEKTAADNAAKKAQIAKDQEVLKAKLKAAEKDLAEKQKPKPIKSFFAKFIPMIKVPTAEDIAKSKKSVEGLKATMEQNGQKMSDLDSKTAAAAERVTQFDVIRQEQAKERGEPDLKKSLTKAESLSHGLETHESVVAASAKVIKGEEQEKAFTGMVKTSFKQEFTLSEELRNGKAEILDDKVDMTLDLVKSGLGSIPLGGVVVNLAMAAVKHAYGQKKLAVNDRVADFGNSSKEKASSLDMALGTARSVVNEAIDGSFDPISAQAAVFILDSLQDRMQGGAPVSVVDQKAIEAGKEIRQGIVIGIAKKVYDCYSVETDGVSPLDGLSSKGQAKFVSEMVRQIIGEISNAKTPAEGSVPTLDREKFQNDPEYREQTSKKYGVKIEGNNFDAAATKIDAKMYIDVVSDSLVSSVIRDKDKTMSASLSNVKFTGDELQDSKGKDLTMDGLTGRIGKVSQNGERVFSAARGESEETGSKYGFRRMTSEEEVDLAKGKEDLKQQKDAVTTLLKPENFKRVPETEEEKAKAVVDLLIKYKSQEKGKELSPEEFLKSDDSPIRSGEKKRKIGGLFTKMGVSSEDPVRTNFNKELKSPLVALLEAADGMSLDVIKNMGKKPEVTAPVVEVETKKGLGVKMTSAAEIFTSIASSVRSEEDQKLMAEFNKPQRRAHISETHVVENVDVVSSLGSYAVNTVKSAVENVGLSTEKSKKDLTTTNLSPEALEAKSNFDKKAAHCSAKKDELVTILEVSTPKVDGVDSKIAATAALTQFVESYHLKAMEPGVTKADLETFAKENLPVPKDNPFMAKKAVDLAVDHSESMFLKAVANKMATEMVVGITSAALTNVAAKSKPVSEVSQSMEETKPPVKEEKSEEYAKITKLMHGNSIADIVAIEEALHGKVIACGTKGNSAQDNRQALKGIPTIHTGGGGRGGWLI